MGILDAIVNGENPLLNIGLGILANNTGHYGQFGPAVGLGGLQGIQQTQQAIRFAQLNKLAQQQEELRKLQNERESQQWEQKQKMYGDQQAGIDMVGRGMAPQFTGPYADPNQAIQPADLNLARQGLLKIAPEAVAKQAFKTLYPDTNDLPKYGMQPRIGINPKTGKPEFVQFGEHGEIKYTGATPTLDELKTQDLIDKGVISPDSPLYGRFQGQIGATVPQQQNNAPQSVPVPSSMPYTWSGPTPTDLKEGTSPDMQLKPLPLPPASRRKVAEAQAMIPVEAATTGAKKAAEVGAETQAKAQADLPQAQYTAESTTKLVDDLLAHPGFKSAVGFSSINPLNKVPGTDANDFNIMLEQLKGKQFMEAYQTLKGGGQITEVEGKKATDAISRMNAASSEKAFVKAAQDFKDAINTGYSKLQQKAGQPASRTIVKRGKYGGRNVVQYSDGSIDYAD